ncbi:hypothetical protein ACX80D_15015 [Arthrobacter sp. Sr24]
MSESDGIEEAIEGMSRVGMTVAGRLGEQLARARETALRRAQAAEEQQGRELQARFDAERAAARAQLAPVMDNRWWDNASTKDIERAHETATAWKDHDPTARNAADTIRDQVQRRYGMDVTELSTPTASIERTGSQDSALPSELDQAREWFSQNDPEYYKQWNQSHQYADTMEASRSDETGLISRWKAQADQQRGSGREETTQAALLLAEANREDLHRQKTTAEENKAAGPDAGAGKDAGSRDANMPLTAAEARTRIDELDVQAERNLINADILEDADLPGQAESLRAEAAELVSEKLKIAESAGITEEYNGTSESERHEQDQSPGLREEAGVKYDSAERREGLAASLDAVADKEAVQARLSADQDQGTPPSAAVAKALGKAPKARKSRGVPGLAKILQKGMSR